MATYKVEIDPIQQTMIYRVEERHLYGSDRLGMYTYGDTVYPLPPAALYEFTWRGYRKYKLKNHLGNVMGVINGTKIPVPSSSNPSLIDYYNASIDATFEYTAFGVTIPEREFTSDGYRYGFNGKEKDDEISGSGNQYDYGFRIYNPRLGKFLTKDPLFKNYAMLTPYQFASNTPIQAIDLDGLEAIKVTGWMQDGVIFNTTTAYNLDGENLRVQYILHDLGSGENPSEF